MTGHRRICTHAIRANVVQTIWVLRAFRSNRCAATGSNWSTDTHDVRVVHDACQVLTIYQKMIVQKIDVSYFFIVVSLLQLNVYMQVRWELRTIRCSFISNLTSCGRQSVRTKEMWKRLEIRISCVRIPEYPDRQLPQVLAVFEQLSLCKAVQLGAPVQFTLLTVEATLSKRNVLNHEFKKKTWK